MKKQYKAKLEAAQKAWDEINPEKTFGEKFGLEPEIIEGMGLEAAKALNKQLKEISAGPLGE
jgi:hypothetical protein